MTHDVRTDRAGLAGARSDAARPSASSPIELAPLSDMVGYALRRAQVAVFRNFARVFADTDIRPSQLGVLTIVANNPGLKQTEIGAALGIKRANIVTLVDGLAARGLVVRERASADRRSHALHLTEAGQELLRDLRARELLHEADVTAAIGPEGRAALLGLLAAVTAACSPPADPVEPEDEQDGGAPP